jgi:exodeoxyribonuclease VII small subunit
MARTDKHAPPKDFESALQELETLVSEMESGHLNLEAALAAYKRGSELAAFCQKTLDAADQQVKVLDNGVLKNLDTAPGDD